MDDRFEDVVARVISVLDAGTAAPSQTAVPDGANLRLREVRRSFDLTGVNAFIVPSPDNLQ